MTNFCAHDRGGLQFNNSGIAVLVGMRLQCCKLGWKNVILLCRGSDILGLILFILERVVPSVLWN